MNFHNNIMLKIEATEIRSKIGDNILKIAYDSPNRRLAHLEEIEVWELRGSLKNILL